MLFERLDGMVNQDGSVVDINEEGAFSDPSINNGAAMSGLETLEWTVKQFARQALRTILVTYKDMSEEEYETLKAENNDFKEQDDRRCLQYNLTAVGIWGI